MRRTHVREGAAIDGLTNPTSNHHHQHHNQTKKTNTNNQQQKKKNKRQQHKTHHHKQTTHQTNKTTTDTQRAGHPAGMFTTSTSSDARTLSVADHSNLLPAAHSVSRLGGRKPTSS